MVLKLNALRNLMIEKPKLYKCACGKKVWQQSKLWKGYCHNCSGECMMEPKRTYHVFVSNFNRPAYNYMQAAIAYYRKQKGLSGLA
jgi:DNA-directed RNA polymerase subunit RPC12/RpoP